MSHHKKIVCWIPFDTDGKAMLDKIKPGDFEFSSKGIDKLPFSIEGKEKLISVEPLTVMKVNGKYCWWFVQGGVLMYT